jgi:hypothetical protein
MKTKNSQQNLRTNSPKNARNTPEGSDAAQTAEKPKKKHSKHTWQGSFVHEDHKPGCMNRHVSWYAASNTCSHRSQARLKAQADFARYLKDGAPAPPPPAFDEWDPNKPGNYQRSASTPFPHEAHHVVAAAELKNCIVRLCEELEPQDKMILMIRDGLLKEQYNVNGQINMIILPMGVEAMKRLGLPIHRKSASHPDYSLYMEDLLRKRFKDIQEAAMKHELPPYQAVKNKLEAVSEEAYEDIKKVGLQLKDADVGENYLEDVVQDLRNLASL